MIQTTIPSIEDPQFSFSISTICDVVKLILSIWNITNHGSINLIPGEESNILQRYLLQRYNQVLLPGTFENRILTVITKFK